MEIMVEYWSKQELSAWLSMMTVGGMKAESVLRIEVNDDGTMNILDFSMPSKAGRTQRNVVQANVPRWIIETISMLRITDDNRVITELGFKVNDMLYYIINREGESND
jgi:hypothetical protein